MSAVYVHVDAGVTRLVPPRLPSWGSSISHDGRFVAFNVLVPCALEAGCIAVRDLATLELDVSPLPHGGDAYGRPVVSLGSPNFAFVVLPETTLELPVRGVWRWDRLGDTLEHAVPDAAGGAVPHVGLDLAMAWDGRRVAFAALGSFFPQHDNGACDLYLCAFADP